MQGLICKDKLQQTEKKKEKTYQLVAVPKLVT